MSATYFEDEDVRVCISDAGRERYESEQRLTGRMVDVHEQQRKAELRQMFEYVDSIEDRLARAKEALGDRYLLAPENRVKRLAKPYGSIR